MAFRHSENRSPAKCTIEQENLRAVIFFPRVIVALSAQHGDIIPRERLLPGAVGLIQANIHIDPVHWKNNGTLVSSDVVPPSPEKKKNLRGVNVRRGS